MIVTERSQFLKDGSPVERFEADDDSEIDLSGVQPAIRAFANGELSLQDVQQVIGAFSN